MLFNILTIFPNLLNSPLEEGILRKAKAEGKIDFNIVDIRNYAFDKHSTTDDRPFGGGEGMVMKAEPLALAVQEIKEKDATGKIIFLTPQGRSYNQRVAEQLAQESSVTLICGRYEGIDDRFLKKYIDDEISLGDFILTGGELAALAVVDSVTRILPGVLGCDDSVNKDTFSRNLLKHPQYTRPRVFEGDEVPEILLSGDHKAIEEYRFIESVKVTLAKRPELIINEHFTKQEKKWLKKNNLYGEVAKLIKLGDYGCRNCCDSTGSPPGSE